MEDTNRKRIFRETYEKCTLVLVRVNRRPVDSCTCTQCRGDPVLAVLALEDS